MLRPKTACPHRALPLAYLKFYVPGPGQCLAVQVAGDGQELNRPALDDDAAAPMLGVSLVPEIGEYRSESDQPGLFFAGRPIERDQNIQILGYARLDVIERRERAADGVSADYAVGLHAGDHGDGLFDTHDEQSSDRSGAAESGVRRCVLRDYGDCVNYVSSSSASTFRAARLRPKAPALSFRRESGVARN